MTAPYDDDNYSFTYGIEYTCLKFAECSQVSVVVVAAIVWR